MNMKMGIEAALRICFLLFLLSASWQDLKKKTIKRSSFLIWGTVGVILQAAHIFSQIFMGTEKMEMQVIVQEVTGLMFAALLGILLLSLSTATEEAMGKGDGCFFLVAGIFLGFWKNMLLLSGGIDSPVAGFMVAKRGVKIDAVYFHAPPYTSERAKQKVVDARSMKDWRTGRSVFNNIIPTTTGAAKAVALVIPSLKGKMTGIAYRVPTADVSVVDLNVRLKKPATYAEVCAKVKEASETYMKGVIEYVDDEVVSSDFIGDPCTSIFDAREGFQLNDRMFKFISFYDNEYGYSSKIVELIKHMASVDNK